MSEYKNMHIQFQSFKRCFTERLNSLCKDIELLKKFEVIQDMNEEDKALVTRFLDLTIRDYKAKKAYS